MINSLTEFILSLYLPPSQLPYILSFTHTRMFVMFSRTARTEYSQLRCMVKNNSFNVNVYKTDRVFNFDGWRIQLPFLDYSL